MTQNEKEYPGLSVQVAIILGALIIAGSIIYAARQGSGAPSFQAAAPVAAPAANVDVKDVSVTGDPVIGAASAPVVVAYWFDYQCPFCKQNEENAMRQVVADYVSTGKIRIVFKDLQFLGTDSTTLGLAARAVWEVAPSKFYDWHKAVFDNQGQENSGWATKDKIRSITAGVLGDALADSVMSLMDSKSSAYKAAIDADKDQGAKLGINSTPTMIIGKALINGAQGYSQIKQAIEDALKK